MKLEASLRTRQPERERKLQKSRIKTEQATCRFFIYVVKLRIVLYKVSVISSLLIDTC